MILDEIINNRKKRLEKEKKILSFTTIKEKAEQLLGSGYKPKDFLSEYNTDQPFLIAEIKKASPSKGIIRKDFDINEIALAYKASPRVKAISVLTEPDYFKGQYDYIKKAKDMTNKPVLMKDFIVDEYQIYRGFSEGASAILLIAAVLKDQEIERYAKLASDLHLHILFETHTLAEYERALDFDFNIIGINNRDLKTFVTDINTTVTILNSKDRPDGRVIISESGISTGQDISMLYNNGVDGFLIGESFMKEKDILNSIEKIFEDNNETSG
jgi:indole-3-glycerol phosphate synthase